MRAQLDRLGQVARASCDAAEARAAGLVREADALRGRIRDLQSARRARADDTTAMDPALRLGVDLRWEGWIDTRLDALADELARCLSDLEIAREALRVAFGRRVALDELAAMARSEGERRRARAEERGGPMPASLLLARDVQDQDVGHDGA